MIEFMMPGSRMSGSMSSELVVLLLLDSVNMASILIENKMLIKIQISIGLLFCRACCLCSIIIGGLYMNHIGYKIIAINSL